MNLADINERYHLKSKVQKRVITTKNFTYRILISIINRHVGKNKSIIDLGSGVGTLDFYLAFKGNNVTGIDASKLAITIAKANAKALGLSAKVKFVQKDLITGKISGKYDVVLLTEVVEHLKNESVVLKRAYQLLKKGGILIVSTRSSNAPLYKFNLAKMHDKRVGHLHRYSIDKLERLLKKANFSAIEMGKREGILRDFLFSFPIFGSQVVRIANKFGVVSDLLSILDYVSMKMFGEAQIYLVAKK